MVSNKINFRFTVSQSSDVTKIRWCKLSKKQTSLVFFSSSFFVQVVPKDAVKDKFRENKIREYFYGSKNNINPHVFTVEFNDIKIYKIGAPQIPDNCLPAGVILKNQYNKIVPIAPSEKKKRFFSFYFICVSNFSSSGASLIHHVLSVSSSNDPEQLLTKNLLGFVVV